MNLSAELGMLLAARRSDLTTVQIVAEVRAAADRFPFDHNIRKTPAALAVQVSDRIPVAQVVREVEYVARHDPYARDVAAQLEHARKGLAQSGGVLDARTRH